jgi:hypothetical protein
MAIRIFFPSKYGKLGRTFFQKKSFVQVAAPFFISPPKKISPLVLSRCCLVLLFAFWLCFDDVAGYGWWITRNMPLGVHWKKKGPKKQQGNFVGRYFWVPNNYKGLAYCVRVFCAALLFFVFTSGVLWRNSTPEGGECERVSGWSFADERGATSWWREKELE